MRFTSTLITLFFGASTTLACSCTHGADAARWIDSYNPGDRAADLILHGGGSVDATVQGKMTVSLNPNTEGIRNCLTDYAHSQTSFHGDWFLWSAIRCEDGGAIGTISIVGF